MSISDNLLRPKIALILPSLVSGGMERVMSELAIYFSTQKHAEVHLVLLTAQDKFYPLPAEVIIHEPSFKHNSGNAIWSGIKTMAYLRKKINVLKPDSVLSFGETYNSFVLIGTLFTAHKIFVSDRSRPDKKWGRLHHFLRNIFYRRAAGIISQTTTARRIMEKRLTHRNIKVIGNPIKTLESNISTQRKNIVLTVGRMIKSKRHDLLIQLFHKTNNENWELHFLGDGPERTNLESIVSSLGLKDKVIFLGTHKDIAPFYAQSKIFAFTSNSEGFPNAIGEAMSAGLAPVTFNFIAGANDLVTNNENGFLVEMGEEDEYIHQLNALMQDEALIRRFSNAAKESMKKFSTDIIAEEYYKFILS
ncbi:MAG: glycosyltransferase [Chitinophagaceae bacterium]|nr:glycosyltransferase [Chitinophagaceae bacterium]